MPRGLGCLATRNRALKEQRERMPVDTPTSNGRWRRRAGRRDDHHRRTRGRHRHAGVAVRLSESITPTTSSDATRCPVCVDTG